MPWPKVLKGDPVIPSPDEIAACEVARDAVLEGEMDIVRAALEQAPHRLARRCPACGSVAGEDCVEVKSTFGGIPIVGRWLLVPHHARLVGHLDAGPLFGAAR